MFGVVTLGRKAFVGTEAFFRAARLYLHAAQNIASRTRQANFILTVYTGERAYKITSFKWLSAELADNL